MKRLIENKASRLVNKTVLDFYGITLSPRIDLADMDKTVIHAIKQAMIFAVTHRYPDQFDWITDLLVDWKTTYQRQKRAIHTLALFPWH